MIIIFQENKNIVKKCGAVKTETDTCSECGSKEFELKILTVENLEVPTGVDENQQPIMEEIEIDYYIPKNFPFVMMKNASDVDSFLGNSDVEAIKDQQNDLNIYTTKNKRKNY